MALSNVLREPRRELIEQGFGILVAGGFVGIDYIAASLIYANLMGPTHMTGDFVFAVFIAAVSIIFVGFAFVLIHWVGEGVCNSMARRGYDPRPETRYP
jgi:hypothetical protein